VEKSYLDIGLGSNTVVLIFTSNPFCTGTPSPFAPNGFEISCKERQSPAIGKIFLENHAAARSLACNHFCQKYT
jgi:hypothetical protein